MLEFIVGDCGFSGLSVVREADHWRMYLSPNACGLDAWSPGGYVLIADAPALSGPWTVQVADDYDEAFFAGSSDDWDQGGITVDSVVPTDEGYVLYYSGLFDTRLVGGSSIGRATSSDGHTWVKHHGPAPDSGHYTASSPVLTYGPRVDWDNFYIQRAAVRHTENGWEMFYSGSRIVNDPNPNNRRGLHSIGYAHSSDGISWVPYPEPILSASDGREYEFSSFVIVDGTYYLYYNYVSVADRTRSIGVATGTIDWTAGADAAVARGVLPPIPFPPGPVGLPEIEVYGAVDGRVSIDALTEPGAWEAIEGAASYYVEYRPLAGSSAGAGSEDENFLSPSSVSFIRRRGPGEYWFTITARSRSQEMLAYTELILYIEPESPAEAGPSIEEIIAEADDGTVRLPAEGEWTITYLDQLVCGSNSWDYVVMNLNPSTITVEDDGAALTLTNATSGSVHYVRVAPNVYQLTEPPIRLVLNSLIVESTLVVRSADLISGQQVDERRNLPTCEPAAFRLDFTGGE